jgi:LPS sulfotransferase NodH
VINNKADLIKSLKELNCPAALSGHGNWILLCDEPFQAYFLSAGIPQKRVKLLAEFRQSRGDFPDKKNVYVICTNEDETPHASVIKARGGQAMGLFSHVVPRLIAGAPPRFNASAAIAPTRCYALISLPRAGSTVLAQELQGLGVGRPTEHIRDPVIEFARHRAVTNFDVFNWWKILTRSQATDQIFGTKIIWDFLQMFRIRLATAEYEWLIEQLSKFTFFYLVREDKVGQAVSDYVARATGVWHRWRDAGKYEEKLKEVADASTNVEQLLGIYNKFRASEDTLRRFLERTGASVTEIQFEQICDDPRREAIKIARQLGAKISEESRSPPSSLERTTSAQHVKIENELRAHLAGAR